MLIGIFCFLSVLSAAAVYLAVIENFGLVRLWLLPAVGIGTFLLLAGLWFLLLVVMAARVDMDAPAEREYPHYRRVIRLTVQALLPLLRIRVRTSGLEQTPRDGRFLLVCNHLDITDPVVLLHCFHKSQLAFISKQENDSLFLAGPFLRAILCQPINRENDREALKTILKCIQLIKEDQVSVVVFPEGYVSADHRLHTFRPGAFKIAQKAKVPIVVCTLRNTHLLLKNAAKLKPSTVHMHLVGVIPAEELEGVTTVDIAERVHKMMADDLGPDLVLPIDR